MTAPGGAWAEAHVDVELNWGDLDSEMIRRLERSAQVAQRAVNKHLDRIAVNAERTFKKMERSFDSQMRAMERRAAIAARTISRELDRIDGVDVDLRVSIDQTQAVAEVRQAHRSMQAWATANPIRFDVDVDAGGAQARLSALLAAMQAQASARPIDVDVNVDTDRSGGGTRALGRLGSMLGGLGRTTLGVVGTVAKFAAIAGAATIAAGSLVPVIGALGAGMVTLGGAAGTVAVGGLFALVAAGAALKTAFTGVGDAAKNMFDPDKAEEFEKSLAKLTPAAQSTMRAVQGLGQKYADIVKTPVQEAMFSGLAPKIAQLSKFLPSVRDSLVGVAEGFNDGANGALRMINSASGMSMVKSLLRDSGNMAGNLGAGITGAIPGFLSLGAAATSVLSPMTDSIGGIGRRWSESMLQMQQDGTLQEKMQGFIDGAKQFGQVLATVGQILGGVFSAAKAAGDGNAFGNIQQSLTQISTWVNGEGQAALTSFFSSIGDVMGAVMPIILQIAGIIGGQVAPMVAQLITTIAPVIETIVSALGQGIAALQPAIGPLASALSAIGTALAPVIPIIGQLIAQLVTMLAPVISALASALGPVLTALGTAFSGILQAMTPIIPVVVQIATVFGQMLTQAITAIAPLLTVVVGALAQVFSALSPLIPILGQVFGQVISALTPVIGVLADVLSKVASILAETLAQALTAMTPLFQAMGPVIEQIGGALGELAGVVGEALITAIQQVAPMFPMIVGAFSQLLAAVLPLVPVLLDLAVTCLTPIIGLLPSLQGIIISVIPIIVQLVQVFAQIIPVIIPIIAIIAKIIGFFVQLLGTILGFVAQALAAIVGFVTGVIAGFIGMVSSVISTVSGWVSSVIGFFSDLASRAISWVTDMWGRVTSGFSDGVGRAVDFVKALPGKIMDALSGAGRWLVDTGKNIIQGLIDGIKSMAGAIVNALINLLPGPLQGVARKALGLALGGWVPALAVGGEVGVRGARARGQASTPIAPGGFIVNARQARKHRGLLRQLSPSGRMLSGPGTSTSDSIAGSHAGRTVAMVSRREFYVPPKDAAAAMPILEAVNSGRGYLQALATGGSVREPYGLAAGTSISYGADGFPAWVYEVGKRFNVQPSTYPGHQERDGKNKGIDWSGSVANMQAFAEYLLSIAPDMEQVIWSNPETGEQIGIADGQRVGPGTSQPGYYSADWSGHQDHVHTRQSFSFGGSTPDGKGIDDTAGLGSGTTTSTPSGSSGAPIGSGIGTGSGSGTASWGNSGGGSKANSIADAKRLDLTPVWVENWPANFGTGGGLSTGGGDLTAGTADTGGLSTTPGPAKDLRKGATKEEITAEIVRQGKERGLSDADIESAVATALVESDMKNYANSSVAGSQDLPHDAVGSDHDSVGIMQQRQSWGTTEDLMDPSKAISKYYDALEKVEGRDSMGVGQRAQAVQRSAVPDRYDQKLGEARDLIGKAGAVPVTPAGNVPVEVTNPPDTTTDSTPDAGLSTTPPDTTTTPDTTTDTKKSTYESMPFGTARANTYLREQDFGSSLRDIGVGGLKETFGEFGAMIGVESFVERGIDEMVGYLKRIAERDPNTEFKWADVVNIHGGDPDKTKAKTTEGMTAVMDTYRGDA